MTRARLALAASFVVASAATTVVVAQTTPPAPPMTSVLAGKKFNPPFKGQAEVDFTKPVTKRDKDMVVTTLQVTNTSGDSYSAAM